MSHIPTNPNLEMLVGSSYVDITADCRLRSADSGGGIEITRGVPNEGGAAEPTQLNFTLNNGVSKVASTLGKTGCYSPRNPLSPYFGLIGRNQRVRLGVDKRKDGFGRAKSAASLQLCDGTFEFVAGGYPVALGWGAPIGGTFVRSDPGWGHTGGFSGRLTTTGTPTQTYVRQDSAYAVPVVPGVSYRAACSIWAPGSTPNISLSIDWLNSSMGFISNTTSGAFSIGADWAAFEASGVAPAGAAYAVYGPTIGINPPAGREIYFDDVDFAVAAGAGWGSLPIQYRADGGYDVGEEWRHYGSPTFFDTVNGIGRITGASGYKIATIKKTYGDAEVLARMKVSDRTSEFGIILRMKPYVFSTPVGIDPTFETGGAGNWISNSGTNIAIDTSVAHTGTKSLRLTCDGVGTGSLVQALTTPTLYGPVTPGKNYLSRVWARCSVATTIRGIISWYGSDLSFKGSSTQDYTVAANTWTLIEVSGTPTQDGYWARTGVLTTAVQPAGTQIWIDDMEFQNKDDMCWYSAYITPGTTDQVRIGKVAPGVARSTSFNMPFQIVAGTWYWIKAQITGQRMRIKVWQDGQPESAWLLRYFDNTNIMESTVGLTGEVGIVSNNGTALLEVDTIEVNQWRAHAEIAELPPRWDIARVDRWVPVQARGILRRLGQGRKALRSAVSLHLQSYTNLSYGWWSLETDTGTTAGNHIEGGAPAYIKGLSFSEPDLVGVTALPGVSGYATLTDDDSVFSASVPKHTSAGKQTMLFFVRVPQAPVGSDLLMCTITSTGTARTWKVWLQQDIAMRVEAIDYQGTILSSTVVPFYFNPDHPLGSWIACTLYLLQSGSNVNYALNYHHPGNSAFYTATSSFAGSVGRYTGIVFRGSAVATAAGNMSISQVMHYNGDLPFVTYNFRRAAVAYSGEGAAARFLRLCANAGITASTIGLSTVSEAMGYQLPAKLTELLEECADVEHGAMIEERDDFALALVTRASLWNRWERVLNIDAGHLSPPLEPNDDDQNTRNDVTVSRPNGGFARAIQASGSLNVNPPETDVDGVGTYDEAPDINFATDNQLQPAANFRRSRGTQDDPRYPSIRVDLAATSYLNDPALVASVLAIDSGDAIVLRNPEVSYDSTPEIVTAYEEKLDAFDWDLTFTANPGRVYQVGVVGKNTRVDTETQFTAVDCPVGSTTQLISTLIGAGGKWVLPTAITDDTVFPFDVMASGVRLRVTMTGNVLNPVNSVGMESGIGDWEPFGGATLAQDRFDPRSGSYCLRATSPGAVTCGPVITPASAFLVTAGEQLVVCGWVKTEVAATSLQLGADFYDASNAVGVGQVLGPSITTSANVWTWYSATITVPAGGVRGRLIVKNTFAGATRAWYDNLRMISVASFSGVNQTLTIEQAPINGVYKTIPAGSQIRLADPWRVGW